MPGASVADVARKHGTTPWQVYDWRKKLRTGQLVLPESVAALPMFAELAVEDTAPDARAGSALEIVVGDVVIRGLPLELPQQGAGGFDGRDPHLRRDNQDATGAAIRMRERAPVADRREGVARP
jgi:transposase